MKQWLLCLSVLALLTGCSRRVTDLPLIACGVDYDGQSYTLTLEGVRQHSLEGDATSVFLTAQGDTLPDAYHRANAQLADNLSFSHLEVIVISPTVPSRDMLTFFAQTAPPDALLAVSYDCTPADILQVEGVAEPLTGLALSALLGAQPNTVQLYQASTRHNSLPQVTCTNSGSLQLLPSTEEVTHVT